jgi:hypothetical protein
MVGDKIFLTKFNLYFFNQSRGMLMNISTTFHIVPVPNFIDVFLARAAIT